MEDIDGIPSHDSPTSPLFKYQVCAYGIYIVANNFEFFVREVYDRVLSSSPTEPPYMAPGYVHHALGSGPVSCSADASSKDSTDPMSSRSAAEGHYVVTFSKGLAVVRSSIALIVVSSVSAVKGFAKKRLNDGVRRRSSSMSADALTMRIRTEGFNE